MVAPITRRCSYRCRMTISTRTVIRPHLLLDVVTGKLPADRAVVIDGHRIAGGVRSIEHGSPARAGAAGLADWLSQWTEFTRVIL
jgi:hypothetical protein